MEFAEASRLILEFAEARGLEWERASASRLVLEFAETRGLEQACFGICLDEGGLGGACAVPLGASFPPLSPLPFPVFPLSFLIHCDPVCPGVLCECACLPPYVLSFPPGLSAA